MDGPLFTELQIQTLRTALDRIIPPDDFPGAWDAGCGEYLVRQLGGQLAHLLPAYRDGLDALEAEALSRYRISFGELGPGEQDAILAKIEAGETATQWSTSPKLFFTALVSHAAEGYYADTGQGGNKNRISWRMIGFNGR